MRKKQGVRSLTRIFCMLTIFGIAGATAGAQSIFKHPQAGDIYKEYSRTMMGYADWRVIDPNATNPGATSRLPNAVLYVYNIDLAHAVRAEAVIDEWGGHAGTNGKAIRFNGNNWLSIPQSKNHAFESSELSFPGECRRGYSSGPPGVRNELL